MLVVTNIYHIHYKVYTRLPSLTHFRDYVAGCCGKNKNACRQAVFLAVLRRKKDRKTTIETLVYFC